MAIRILIEAQDGHTSAYDQELDQSLITFGRSKSCHIELDSAEVSRRHFLIKYTEQGYVVIDDNSRHGTILDGQTLTADKPYLLSDEHTIAVPGFVIKLLCDGESPRLERTTVVARQLLDELLQGEAKPRESPKLRNIDGGIFSFSDEKTTYVLGTHEKADFVVHDDSVSKKHLSFTRDINGIRIIPIVGNAVAIDGSAVSAPAILHHGAVLTVGGVTLIFSDHESSVEEEVLQLDQEEAAIIPEAEAPLPETPKVTPPKKNPYYAWDRLFLAAFVVVAAALSLILFELV